MNSFCLCNFASGCLHLKRIHVDSDYDGSISSDYGSKQNVNERFLAVRPCGGMTFNADRHWRTSNRADADRQHWQVPGGHPDYHRSQPNHRERIIPIEMNDDYSIIDDSCSASTRTSPSRANGWC
ncbi:hypothetical protein AB6A40_008648 [Gnathostoma spinigerum]|uniref:Uncharacterized protein n=1 Tax=Gnathostoma spinigerum TaxID=75299 RepID=A0ABD6EUS9_9BILA